MDRATIGQAVDNGCRRFAIQLFLTLLRNEPFGYGVTGSRRALTERTCNAVDATRQSPNTPPASCKA